MLYIKMTTLLLPLTRVVVRLSDTSFHHVVRDTPRTVPFWNGSTYSDVLYRFVPSIFRFKHSLYHAWHDFGLKYKTLGSEDRETSVAFNYFTEGYMNFGLLGLISTSVIIGSVLALLQWVFVLRWGASLTYLVPLVSYRVMDITQPLTTFLQSTYHAVVLIGAAHVLQSLAMLIWLNYQRWKDSTFESYKYG